jgi:outer membrane biosynthesis protein TonB
MRETYTDPRLLLAALAAAFVLALLAAGPPLDLNDLGLFSGGATAVEAPAAQPAGTPAWVEDPMASPLTELRGH